MITKSDGLMDDLTSTIINHMYRSQFIQMEYNSIKVYFNKNYASLLNNQIYLQDSSANKFASGLCSLLGLGSLSCSTKVVSERVF